MPPLYPMGSLENPCTNEEDRQNAHEQGVHGIDPYCYCMDCNSVQRWREMTDGWHCEDCYRDNNEESDEDSIPEREYVKTDSPLYQSEEAGSIITSPRIFSAEIECYASDYSVVHAAGRELDDGIGISDDNSLSDYGVEFQTPKLKGARGEQLVRHITRILNRHDFTVNNDCGLHIHLDDSGLIPSTETTKNPISIKQLWKFYILFDDVLLSFLPYSRRSNRYALSMRQSALLASITECKSQRDLEKLWYKTLSLQNIQARKKHKYDDSRYAGINFHSLFNAGHLEVRFHSGTLNADKILYWTALHQAILDKAAIRALVMKLTEQTIKSMSLEQKTLYMFNLLDLPASVRVYLSDRQSRFASNPMAREAQTDEQVAIIEDAFVSVSH